jgi:sugar O-acyltransferase (sialic acid O-acetyltransferase NeuD family)
VGFLDDNAAVRGTEVIGIPVIGGTDDAPRLAKEHSAGVLVGIGDNLVRGRLLKKLVSWGVPITRAIHPSAVIADNVVVEPGVVIMPAGVVNTRSRVQFGAVINTNASVDHDCDLGEMVNCMPGSVLTGGIIVGRYANMGSRSVVIPLKKIGENAYVGAGAVIIRDVPANSVVVGVPGNVIKYREPLPVELRS